MDGELDRSVRLLDEAVAAQLRRRHARGAPAFEDTFANLSHMLDAKHSPGNTLLVNTLQDTSILSASLPTANSLYVRFFEILQTHMQSNELLQSIADMSSACSDTLTGIQNANAKSMHRHTDDVWLENERNTWRLIYILYSDRLNRNDNDNDDEGDLPHYLGLSEKFCMLSLFKRNHLVRECQLVVDWLECNAAQKPNEIFPNISVGWENTLHQLKSKETIVFESTHKIVSSIDPDAQHREGLPLHDLDMDDDRKLTYKIFHEIRCGRLQDAQKLACQCGHFWRAAQLEGWKLHHNPNLEDRFTEEFDEGFVDGAGDKEERLRSVEGNESRDLWKKTAWNYAMTTTLDTYEKASIAAFSGNLKPLLNVCKTWEDYLWAHMRVMVDIRVESELREYVTRNYRAMPMEYWEQKMSINEIFGALEASKHKHIQREAAVLDHIVQKHLILAEIPQLVDTIGDWVLDTNISAQFLRFLTHLLLFLEQIDLVHNREVVERVIEEYLKCLMRDKETQLVAFYASKLNESTQIYLYANYLEHITDNDKRLQSLRYADECGLNVFAITTRIVESIREKNANTKSDELNEFQINSLDWLLFYGKQLAELVRQSNALVYNLLYQHRHDSAKLAFNKVPADGVAKLTSGAAGMEDLPDELHQLVREHLAYKAYFDAQEAFSVWFQAFKCRPQPPEKPADTVAYAKKVEYEHKLSQHNAELARWWKIIMEQHSKLAKTALYNVLLFPDGGWLHGAKEAYHLQMTYIPQCCFLLFNVLYESQQFEECVQLADLLANEKMQLYKHFLPSSLVEILRKITEASVALLKQGKDACGYDTRG